MRLYKENGEIYPAVKILQDADPAPAGYTEVTDIEEVYALGQNAISISTPGWTDKLCFRSKLKTLIYTKMQIAAPADVSDPAKWALLSDAEKSIAAHLFLVAEDAFLLEVKDDSRYWLIEAGKYRNWTQAVRTERAERAESIVFMRMQNLGDAKLVLADLSQISKDTVLDVDDITKGLKVKAKVKRLNRMYIEGLEDEEHDGIVAIKDWIQSKAGTPFETNGFKNLSYPLKTGHTYDSVANEMLSILDGTF